jgi:hypothetical protein
LFRGKGQPIVETECKYKSVDSKSETSNERVNGPNQRKKQYKKTTTKNKKRRRKVRMRFDTVMNEPLRAPVGVPTIMPCRACDVVMMRDDDDDDDDDG